jgi:hypothetical protein
LLDHPSRTRELGLASSIFQAVKFPSSPFTFNKMKVCGLVNLNLLHRPDEFDGVFMVEHCERVMRRNRAAENQKCAAYDSCPQLVLLHPRPPAFSRKAYQISEW